MSAHIQVIPIQLLLRTSTTAFRLTLEVKLSFNSWDPPHPPAGRRAPGPAALGCAGEPVRTSAPRCVPAGTLGTATPKWSLNIRVQQAFCQHRSCRLRPAGTRSPAGSRRGPGSALRSTSIHLKQLHSLQQHHFAFTPVH